MIDTQLDELSRIMQRASHDFDYEVGEERLRRWKTRTVKLVNDRVNPDEGSKLLKKHTNSNVTKRPQEIVEENVRLYRGFLLKVKDGLTKYPEDILAQELLDKPLPEVLNSKPAKAITGLTRNILVADGETKKVFIVFGRDELNSLRLEKILRERGLSHLELLSTHSDTQEHLIDTLNHVGEKGSSAIFLFTPEDFVRKTGSKIPLARPEFLFGLGWFCCRVGFERVWVLSKKGAKFPPGLANITCIEFENSVADAVEEIEEKIKELDLA